MARREFAQAVRIGLLGLAMSPVVQGQVLAPAVELELPDGGMDAFFGSQIDIDGGYLYISAPSVFQLPVSPGLVAVYDLESLTYLDELVPDLRSPVDRFGRSMSIAQGVGVVSGECCNYTGPPDAGQTVLFDLADPTDPRVIRSIRRDEADYGQAIGVSRSFFFIYNRQEQFTNVLSVETGELVGIIDAEVIPEAGGLSDDVMLRSSTLSLGGIYSLNAAGAPSLITTLDPSPLGFSGFDATKIILTDEYVFWGGIPVGVYPNGGMNTAVGIWERGTGEFLSLITSPDWIDGGFPTMNFAYDSGLLVVGAAYWDPHWDPSEENSYTVTGSAYVYDVSDPRRPVFLTKLAYPDGRWRDLFGLRPAVKGDTVVVGSMQADGFSGRVLVYDLSIRPCGLADFGEPFNDVGVHDVMFFLDFFLAQNNTADINADGVVNFFDLAKYLEAFSLGCP